MILFKQNMKRIFQSKAKAAILLLAPLLFIVMFALNQHNSFRVGIADKDNSYSSNYLKECISGIDGAKVVLLEEKDLLEKTEDYNVEYSIIIEKGFEEQLLSGKTPDIREFYIAEKEKLFYVRSYINNQITNLETIARGNGYDAALFREAADKYRDAAINIFNEQKTNAEIPKERLALGFLVQFMLYMGLVTTGVMLEDRSSGTFLRTFYAPVKLKRYIGESFAAFEISAVVQLTFVMFVLRFIFSMGFNNGILTLCGLLLIYSVTCVALGLWIISLFKKPLLAYIFIFAIATPLSMLGGCYWPSSVMPDIMKKIGYFMPTSWVMDGIEKVLYNSKTFTDILFNAFILVIFAGLFLSAGLLRKVEAAKV